MKKLKATATRVNHVVFSDANMFSTTHAQYLGVGIAVVGAFAAVMLLLCACVLLLCCCATRCSFEVELSFWRTLVPPARGARRPWPRGGSDLWNVFDDQILATKFGVRTVRFQMDPA